MRTVGLYTLGCKVSQYETEAIGETFEARGFRVMPFDSVCDAYVINTCTVTAESDRKSRQIIRRAIQRNPDAVVAVVGCYSQRTPEELLRINGVDIVLGTDKKLDVVDRVEFMLENSDGNPYCKVEDLDKADFEPMTITKAARTRAYVKIEDGCESKCTYCAISSARGRVRSKLPEDVIAEVEGLYRSGTKEIPMPSKASAWARTSFMAGTTASRVYCACTRWEAETSMVFRAPSSVSTARYRSLVCRVRLERMASSATAGTPGLRLRLSCRDCATSPE